MKKLYPPVDDKSRLLGWYWGKPPHRNPQNHAQSGQVYPSLRVIGEGMKVLRALQPSCWKLRMEAEDDNTGVERLGFCVHVLVL